MTDPNELQQAYAQTDAHVADDITESTTVQDGKIITYREQDVEPYLDANAQAYNDVGSWRPWAGKSMRPVAEIPMIVVEQWMREGFNLFDDKQEGYQRELKRRLNDITNRKLRTAPGRI